MSNTGKIILTLVILALIGFFVFGGSKSPEQNGNDINTFAFFCAEDDSVITIELHDDESATLALGGELYDLSHVVSASGARYANEDESVVFWNHGAEALVEMNGNIVYQACMLALDEEEVVEENNEEEELILEEEIVEEEANTL